MHYREGTLFSTTVLKNANADRVFTAEDGFNIAIAVIETSSSDLIGAQGRNIEEYLEIVAEQYTWDHKEEILEFISLEPHPCTKEELGFSGSEDSKKFNLSSEW